MVHVAWADELNPGGRWMANTWQGEFPRDRHAIPRRVMKGGSHLGFRCVLRG